MGKGFMAMAFIWLVVTIAGNIASGSVAIVATYLTADIDSDDTTITVASTTGFPDTGLIQIEDEVIAYGDITATTFKGGGFLGLTQSLIRGAQSTEAAAHVSGTIVRTVEGAMLNQSAAYSMVSITESSGIWMAVTIPIALFNLLGSFLFLPLQFLGTDLAILTYVWAVIGIGMIVALGVALAGGRRV